MNIDQIHDVLLSDEEYRKAYAAEDLIHRVAERVMRLRKKNDLSQSELAKRCDTRQPAIAKIEGGFANLTLRRLATLAYALRCRAEDLVTREEPIAPAWGRTDEVLPTSRSRTVRVTSEVEEKSAFQPEESDVLVQVA